MYQHCIKLDERCEEIMEQLVPVIYPSMSEMFRDLLRKEHERLQEKRLI